MQNRRTHYFPDNDCTVITGLLPDGQFGAYRETEDEGRVRGIGHSRLSAIADMVEWIQRGEMLSQVAPADENTAQEAA